jgi:hypothetical protein
VADLLGHSYALSGRVAEGLTLLQEALTVMEARGLAQWRSPLIVHLGEAHLRAHQLEEALRVGRQGLTRASERGHRAIQARALRLLGDIVSRFDPPDATQANSHCRQALALAEELGMRPLAAHCHLGLGRLSRRAGHRVMDRQHLTTAATMYSEMDMGLWLGQAQTALDGDS